MVSRLGLLLILIAAVLCAASRKNVGYARGENEDLKLTMAIYIDPADIKELIGFDLDGHYIVADVTVEPKYGKTVLIDRDDFLLITNRDGEKARPFAPSQVVGAGALVLGQVTDNSGIGSPGWSGAVTPVIRSGGATATAKENPLKEKLEKRMLPAVKTDKPAAGLLYFPMEKQKMKDLELLFGGRENRITLAFKPQ